MNWMNELKIEDLRGDYAELAAVIGLELTVRFAEECGGEPLLLPTETAELHHPDQLRSGYLDVYMVTGCMELTNQVAQKLGGGQLYLPQARHALKAAKERYVKANDKTHNRRLLARETGLSLRHVYRICEGKTQSRRSKRDEDPRQLSLLPVSG
jgi:Mor transcription activator family